MRARLPPSGGGIRIGERPGSACGPAPPRERCVAVPHDLDAGGHRRRGADRGRGDRRALLLASRHGASSACAPGAGQDRVAIGARIVVTRLEAEDRARPGRRTARPRAPPDRRNEAVDRSTQLVRSTISPAARTSIVTVNPSGSVALRTSCPAPFAMTSRTRHEVARRAARSRRIHSQRRSGAVRRWPCCGPAGRTWLLFSSRPVNLRGR